MPVTRNASYCDPPLLTLRRISLQKGNHGEFTCAADAICWASKQAIYHWLGTVMATAFSQALTQYSKLIFLHLHCSLSCNKITQRIHQQQIINITL
eukprot:16429421-Heterocapsa_arctica.AAC.1